MSDKTRSNHLLSYPVIVLASGGDVDATYAVFRYNRNTSTYENWGMSSSLVNRAWEVSPENVTVSYTTGSDTESFNIDHRP